MRPYLIATFFLLSAGFCRAGETGPHFNPVVVKEPAIPRRTVNVNDFGAQPDGQTLNTEAIRKAINALAQKGGGHLIFPAGIWLTGPIELKSKIDLHLEAGALVQFSRDLSQYPVQTNSSEGDGRIRAVSPVTGENLTDIAITGRGVIDGGGDAWRPARRSKLTESQWKQRTTAPGSLTRGDTCWPSAEAMRDLRPRLIHLVGCHQVLLDGPTFQNSPDWNLNPRLCVDVTIRNVDVRNPWYAQNGDGLDAEHCRNVIIRDSRFDVGDDAICLKSGTDEAGRKVGVPTENVLVENCVVYHGHGGFTIGSEMSAGVRNVRVNNCLFIGTDLGLRFKSTRGRGGVVENIFVSNIRMVDIPTDAIGFNMYYGGQSPTETAGNPGDGEPKTPVVDEGTPQFRDIYLSHILCRGARRAVALQGLPEMPIRGIHLQDVQITSDTGIDCVDAQNITFERVTIQNIKGPVLQLSNCRDLSIDHLQFPSGAEAVIAARGEKNAGIVVKNTDLKAAKTDFVAQEGADRSVLQIK